MEKISQNDLILIQIEQKNVLFFKELSEAFKISEKDEQIYIGKAKIQESSEEFASSFKCFICKKLAHNLKICSKCDDGIFCSICYSDWKRNIITKQKCPCCQQTADDAKDPDKILLKMRNQNVMLQCPHQNCILNPQEFTNYDKIIDHLKNCLLSQKTANCPQNCGETIKSLEQGQTHFEQCQRGLEKCKNCPLAFIRNENQEHDMECTGFILQCFYCNLELKRSLLDNHVLNDCLEKEIECEICKENNIKRKDMKNHLSEFCLENITECQQCEDQFKIKNKNNHSCIKFLRKMIQQQSQSIQQFKQHIKNQDEKIMYLEQKQDLRMDKLQKYQDFLLIQDQEQNSKHKNIEFYLKYIYPLIDRKRLLQFKKLMDDKKKDDKDN